MLEKILKKTIHNQLESLSGWDEQKVKKFQQNLLSWYYDQRRRLPWREKPSLYGTVVSEFMLQQTRVSTVLPYFERWMKEFPDFKVLAGADESDVLKLWEGLGYYSRARNLHKLAKQIVELESIPQTRAEWLEFPGVGPYASAAISSIAFEEPEAVVDGNVVRIFARLFKDHREYKGTAEATKKMATLTQSFLNLDNPGDHNQAVMELGATVCLPKKPLCLICPVREYCLARLSEPDAYPKIKRRVNRQVIVSRAFSLSNSKLLLYKHPDDSPRLAGLYELPKLESLVIRGRPRLLFSRARAISNEKIKEMIYNTDIADNDLPSGHSWVNVCNIDEVPMSGPHRAWVMELISKQD